MNRNMCITMMVDGRVEVNQMVEKKVINKEKEAIVQ